jgi:hypothetical protein
MSTNLGWTWAVKLAEMDRIDYCRKQTQEQARYVSQLPKQQLGGSGTEHCFAAIGAGSGNCDGSASRGAQKPGGAARGMQMSVHEKWRPGIIR